MTKLLRCLVALLVTVVAQSAFAAGGVVISQVYGGGGNTGSSLKNDFIELFNAGSGPVSINGWSVQYASATGTSYASSTALPNVTLQPGQYFLIQEGAGGAGTVSLSPDASGSINLSATAGRVALVNTTTVPTTLAATGPTIVDFVGFGTTAATYEGSGPAPAPSVTNSVSRANFGCTDTNYNGADFAAGTANPRNSGTALRPCSAPTNAPIVTTCPNVQAVAGAGGSGTASATDTDSIVNGVVLSNAPAGVTLGSFTAATANGGTASVPILVDATVAAGNYQITLTWANNTAQSAMCTPTVSVVNLTPISTIQGSGSTSPLVGQTVVTQGVVTRLAFNGFYLQDAVGDGNPSTSDGVFVFTSTAPPATVHVGDIDRVSATVSEFNVGLASNADTSARPVTELGTVTNITVVGAGPTISPVTVTFPLTSLDDLEPYEGMLVTMNGPFTVTDNSELGEFGNLILAAQGRTENPTNHYRPGSSAQALDLQNRLRTIQLRPSGATDPNPTPYLSSVDHTLRVGDTTPSLTGVLTYAPLTDTTQPGSWVIVPTVDPVFTRVNQRPTAPDDVGGTIRIGSANIENYFTTFTNGQTASGATGQGCALGSSVSASNCRGADNAAEFQRQIAKIVAELVALNADVIGLMEVQNDSGASTQTLVDAINANLGSTVYAAVPDAAQGMGTDAIKVAMIYKPAKLTRTGASVSDPNPIHNRAPLAQTFTEPGGSTFTLVVNHLRAKSCTGSSTGANADQGDLQGCNNAVRVQQAQATRSFVSSLFPSGPLPNVILVGDFNAYAMEDPINDFVANGGYIEELGRFDTFPYSYQFGGLSGHIDQMLTSPLMSQKVKRAEAFHINSDEPSVIDYNLEYKQPACATCSPDYYTPTPYRASDHDPLVIGVSFNAAPPATPPKKGK